MAENFSASNGYCPCDDIFIPEHPQRRKSKYSWRDHAVLYTILGRYNPLGCLGLPNYHSTTCTLLFKFKSSQKVSCFSTGTRLL